MVAHWALVSMENRQKIVMGAPTYLADPPRHKARVGMHSASASSGQLFMIADEDAAAMTEYTWVDVVCQPSWISYVLSCSASNGLLNIAVCSSGIFLFKFESYDLPNHCIKEVCFISIYVLSLENVSLH